MIAVHTPELTLRVVTPNALPATLPLGADTVEVWHANQSAISGHLDNFRATLSADEISRANRFRFDKDRNQFVTARGLLRSLLSRYIGTDPRRISFRYSEKGKPFLADCEYGDVQFNVAHSGDVILLAFARGARVGVDVEQVRTDFATHEVAERFFSVAERESLRAMPTQERHQAFFRCWTRKEAYIKATGDGLSLPLHQFDVTLGSAEPAQLIATRPHPGDAERWALYHLDVGPGYAAALALERA